MKMFGESSVSNIRNYQENPTIHYYVDGSFNTNTFEYGSGIVAVHNGEVLWKHTLCGNDIETAKIRNVAGELRGAMSAVINAVKCGINNVVIHYDYAGVENWVTGSWKANKLLTKQYREFMLHYTEHMNIQFVKVKAHSGDPFNDLADELAKQACGVV